MKPPVILSTLAGLLLTVTLGCGVADRGTLDSAGGAAAGGKLDDPASCAAPCDENERCFDGTCVVDLCDDTVACSEGGACLDGACCYSDDECGFCDSEDCYGFACGDSSDCGENERCVDGACVVELCDDTVACSEGGACLDGACCYSDDECGFCDSEDCWG